MPRNFKVIPGLFLLAGLVFMIEPAHADILNFTATLDGNQASACAGTGSAGTGTGTFTLDTDTGLVNYNITFSGLSGTETVSHVHGPAAACAGASPAYNLPLGDPKIGNTTLNASSQADMINGLHYVNIHSTVDGGGEIRGQVLQVPADPVPAVSDWGLVVMLLLTLTAGTMAIMRRRTALDSH